MPLQSKKIEGRFVLSGYTISEASQTSHLPLSRFLLPTFPRNESEGIWKRFDHARIFFALEVMDLIQEPGSVQLDYEGWTTKSHTWPCGAPLPWLKSTTALSSPAFPGRATRSSMDAIYSSAISSTVGISKLFSPLNGLDRRLNDRLHPGPTKSDSRQQ